MKKDLSTKQYTKFEMELRSFASTIVSRAQLSATLGQTFNGNRDLYEVLGYKKILRYQNYKDLYERGNIAGRVVDAYPQATWSHAPEISVTSGPAKKFKTAWKELASRLKINSLLDRADRLSGIGRFGIVFIGLKDGQSVEKQAKRISSSDDILFLAPYGENAAKVESLVTNTSDPRYSKPEYYSIQTNDVAGSLQNRNLKVHHSRVLHIAEGLLDNEIYGRPRLQRVYNLFDDLAKVVGGSAEFFWRIADRGMQFDIDKDMELDKADEDALEDEVDEYMHGFKRWMKTRGVTAKVLGSHTADPRGSYNPIIALISGSEGIPQRILTGSERGQLASSQDRASWIERVSDRQRVHADPNILSPLIDMFISFGALPEVEHEIIWPIVMPETEDERSVIAARTANAILNVSKQHQVGKIIVARSEFREKYLGLPATSPELEKEEKEQEEEKLEDSQEENEEEKEKEKDEEKGKEDAATKSEKGREQE